jgi:hypothetical protein
MRVWSKSHKAGTAVNSPVGAEKCRIGRLESIGGQLGGRADNDGCSRSPIGWQEWCFL